MPNTPIEQTARLTALILALGLWSGALSGRVEAREWTPSESCAVGDTGTDEAAGAAAPESPQGAVGLRAESGLIFKDRVAPHWFHNNTRFWYRNILRDGASEFVLVDAEAGTRRPAFDHVPLAAALSKASGREVAAERLPFDRIEFAADGLALVFEFADKTWRCDVETYACAAVTGDPEPATEPGSPGALDNPQAERRTERSAGARRSRERGRGGDREDRPLRSPDDRWEAFVKGENVHVRSAAEGQEWQLSTDGREGNAYGRLEWAPDSRTLVAWRIEPGDRLEVHLMRSSPPGGGRARLESRPYDLPGDKLPRFEPNLFSVGERTQLKPKVDRFEHGWLSPRLRWDREGRRFAYEQVDRGHQRFRLIEVDAHTGDVRNLIDERAETFIWTAHTENLRLESVNWLEDSEEILYASERDGWRHLYLIDARSGQVKNQITQGPWVVRAIDRIDEKERHVWFRASGLNADQDPYFLHYYRIGFDGSGLVALTEANGDHTVEFSPDRKYLIDTYSRVDLPPVNELRRAADGALVCHLEQADITALKASGWEAPEVFVAKGRDGRTDIWGIICRPPGLDPTKKYPVIEQIYAGPQGSYVPKRFSPARRFASLTDLGFIVVQMDGMGTANRSKAFHDVCWKNLKDAGFPDRILWHQAVAAKYPFYDLSRVGVYGNSAGGQSAAGALLFHGDFYKAAVASCGCHDNRMDKASWNEQWMGYPVGPQYAECSNIENAARLGGKLFLIVGEMDDNVPPESTLRLADALIKAGKDFDLLLIPGGGHGMGGAYGQRRMQDFFVRHLQGFEPPDRNAGTSNP